MVDAHLRLENVWSRIGLEFVIEIGDIVSCKRLITNSMIRRGSKKSTYGDIVLFRDLIRKQQQGSCKNMTHKYIYTYILK